MCERVLLLVDLDAVAVDQAGETGSCRSAIRRAVRRPGRRWPEEDLVDVRRRRRADRCRRRRRAGGRCPSPPSASPKPSPRSANARCMVLTSRSATFVVATEHESGSAGCRPRSSRAAATSMRRKLPALCGHRSGSMRVEHADDRRCSSRRLARSARTGTQSMLSRRSTSIVACLGIDRRPRPCSGMPSGRPGNGSCVPGPSSAPGRQLRADRVVIRRSE